MSKASYVWLTELNIELVFEECFDWEARKKFDVISHGDWWINNLMFKYADDEDYDNVSYLKYSNYQLITK